MKSSLAIAASSCEKLYESALVLLMTSTLAGAAPLRSTSYTLTLVIVPPPAAVSPLPPATKP